LYVKFHEEAEEEEKLEDKGKEWSKKVEEGDEEAIRLWNMFRDASIEYHQAEYQKMGVSFDRWTGESTVIEETEEVIKEGIEEGVIEEDEDGSLYIEFEEMPDTVLKRADGSTLYLSRDLGNLKKRSNEGFDLNLYVVASEQNLHFKQLFKAAEMLGMDNKGCEHVSYGMVRLGEGSMSSREGRIIRLSEVLEKSVEKAREKIEGSEYEGDPEAVGIGAFKYANLAVSRNKDIQFSWDEALSFEGDSGPYLQYSNTRARSILEKAETEGELAGEFGDGEYQLLKKISEFPESVEYAAKSRDPVKIASYLSDLCEQFNTFYHDNPVLQSGEETRKRRLKIVELFERVTRTGLELLGIETLEEM
ncbi:MAG: arginine--tRNA ligase, partial [Candidatus Nanohaloarchaea archaeon]|nr:arginine--tRNA ligase [Candidatus Nanohaloarchaea archaeon]